MNPVIPKNNLGKENPLSIMFLASGKMWKETLYPLVRMDIFVCIWGILKSLQYKAEIMDMYPAVID